MLSFLKIIDRNDTPDLQRVRGEITESPEGVRVRSMTQARTGLHEGINSKFCQVQEVEVGFESTLRSVESRVSAYHIRTW